MREGFFFIPKSYTVLVQYLNTLLPNLHHLKLQGVHVHWSVLNLILTWQNNVSLVSLELDYYSRNVRPSLEEFYLRTLSSRYSRFAVLVQSSPIQMTMSLLPTTFVNSFTFLV